MSTMAKSDPIPVDDHGLFFRQIVDSTSEPLHTARPDGYLDFFYRRWLDLVGVPLERLLGWGWASRVHPDDVEAFMHKMRESFAKGKPFQEASRRRGDRVYRWMLHHRVASLPHADEEFVLYGTNTQTSLVHPPFSLRGPASMQPALDTYQNRPCIRPRVIALLERGL